MSNRHWDLRREKHLKQVAIKILNLRSANEFEKMDWREEAIAEIASWPRQGIVQHVLEH